MLVPIKLRVPSLGLVLDAEVEVPDSLVAGAAPTTLTDAELRVRWRRSARTLARLRNAGKLLFVEPTPGNYLYKLADIEAIEQGRGQSRQAAPRARIEGRKA